MKAIVHADKNWGIGSGNSLMFRLPADMKFFRQTTTGNTVVIGGNTLRSFPGGLPLKDRLNIVLSKSIEDRQDCIVVRSECQLFDAIKHRAVGEVYVAGGASIYKLLLPYCESVLVTKVDADGGADTFFPDLDADGSFALESCGDDIVTNGFTIRMCVYRNLFPKQI